MTSSHAFVFISLATFLMMTAASCQSAGGGANPASLARDYSALGDEYYRLSKFDKAEAAYRKALELDPSLTIGTYQLARSYAETGQTAKAAGLADLLLAKDPANALFIALKAFIQLKDGKPAEARKTYAALSAELPWGQDVIFNLALLDILEGKAADAQPRLELLLSQKPDDNDAMLLLSRARFMLGKEEEGRLLLNDYLKAKPSDAEAQRLMARSLVRSREYGEALSWWEKLQGGGTADREVWLESAKIYALAMEDDQKGKSALKKAALAGELTQKESEDFLSPLEEGRRQAYEDILREAKIEAEGQGGTKKPGP